MQVFYPYVGVVFISCYKVLESLHAIQEDGNSFEITPHDFDLIQIFKKIKIKASDPIRTYIIVIKKDSFEIRYVLKKIIKSEVIEDNDLGRLIGSVSKKTEPKETELKKLISTLVDDYWILTGKAVEWENSVENRVTV